jgi:putative transposase
MGSMSTCRSSLLCFARQLLADLIVMVRLVLTSRAQLAADNLFLRKQLALYQERRSKPRRADAATRVALVLLSQFLDWRSLLTVIKPETLIRWHRQGWRLFAGSLDPAGRPFRSICSVKGAEIVPVAPDKVQRDSSASGCVK